MVHQLSYDALIHHGASKHHRPWCTGTILHPPRCPCLCSLVQQGRILPSRRPAGVGQEFRRTGAPGLLVHPVVLVLVLGQFNYNWKTKLSLAAAGWLVSTGSVDYHGYKCSCELSFSTIDAGGTPVHSSAWLHYSGWLHFSGWLHCVIWLHYSGWLPDTLETLQCTLEPLFREPCPRLNMRLWQLLPPHSALGADLFPACAGSCWKLISPLLTLTVA